MSYRSYVFVASLVLLVCAAAYVLLPAYRQYRQTRTEQKRLQSTLLQEELDADALRGEIHAIQEDPKAVERVAREKFGWCQEDEKIYHFESPPPADAMAEGR